VTYYRNIDHSCDVVDAIDDTVVADPYPPKILVAT